MRLAFSLFLLCGLVAGCDSDEGRGTDPTVYDAVEQMPEMLPSPSEGQALLRECIRYPEMAERAGIEGTVFVQLVVDERGAVTDAVVTWGIGAGADEEALRCVKMLRYTPGYKEGRPVKVRFSLPVLFELP